MVLSVAAPAELVSEVIDGSVHARVLFPKTLDFVAGVHHRRVVAAAEVAAYLLERMTGERARQVHGDLPRIRDRLRAALRLQLGELDAKLLSHRPHNIVEGERRGDMVDGVAEGLLREVEVDRLAVARGRGR